MTTAFIKINFNNGENYFNIWVGSDGRLEDIEYVWQQFLSYIYLDELEKGNSSRLNWTYMSSNFMRFLSERYLNKNSFNSNRVCVAPVEWEDNAINVFSITPIAADFSNFKTNINKCFKFEVLK